jgi:ribosomal protein S8E
MASRSPSPSKRGRREDDDDESRRRKKLEKGKEPAAKDVKEEPLFDDTKFIVELLRSAFKKLEGVGEAFDIKAHHDVYKDPSTKGFAFRIHGLAEKLENLPEVKQAARRHFIFDNSSSDCDNGIHDCHTRFYKENRMHLTCAPGSIYTHMIDKMSLIPLQ